MAQARVVEELFVKAPTRVGLLADIATEIANAGVDIQAIGAYDKEGHGEFMLITSDNAAAEKAVFVHGATVERNEVVVVDLEDAPGTLAEAARKLAAAEINVDWVYATTGDGPHATAVFKTAEPQRTADVLNS